MSERIHVPAFDRLLMTCRVFWRETETDDDPRQGWYWVETDETGGDFGQPFGPFETGVAAGANARDAIVHRSECSSANTERT